MTESSSPVAAATLLDELDARQNQVLDELDALDARISATIKEWTVDRKEVSPAEQPLREAA